MMDEKLQRFLEGIDIAFWVKETLKHEVSRIIDPDDIVSKAYEAIPQQWKVLHPDGSTEDNPYLFVAIEQAVRQELYRQQEGDSQ